MGLYLSYPRYTVLEIVKHLWSWIQTSTGPRRNISSSSPVGGGWNALDTKVAAVGEGPAGGVGLPRFSRSRGRWEGWKERR